MSDLAKRILDTNDIKSTLLEVPEWGVTVKVQALPAGKTLDLYGSGTPGPDTGFHVVVLCVFDPETDEQLFSVDDIPTLRNKSSSSIQRIMETVNKLGGLDEAIQITKKNSKRTSRAASSVN